MNAWSRAAVVAWLILTAVVVGYELYCVVGGNPKTPPLTDVTIRYVPWWLTMPFLVWLIVHFVLHYVLNDSWTSKGFGVLFSK